MTLTDTDLDLLRGEGDRSVDDGLQGIGTARARNILGELASSAPLSEVFCRRHRIQVPDGFWDEQFDFDRRRLDEGVRLFREHGSIIGGALLLSALPSSYAAIDGAQVLGATERLRSSPKRRFLQVVQFLLDVTTGAEDYRRMYSPDHPGFQAARSVRLFHGLVRRAAPEHSESVWINQEDQIGTLLMFSVNVFEVLERLNLTWTVDEQDSYLYLWDCVGTMLGVGEPDAVGPIADSVPLRPQSVAGATQLLAKIRNRQWPTFDDRLLDSATLASVLPPDPAVWPDETPPYSSLPRVATCRQLFRALMDEIDKAMPRGARGRALSTSRYLVDERVRVILGMGEPGLVTSLMEDGYRNRRRLGPSTSYRAANPLLAKEKQFWVEQIAARSFMHFVRDAPDERPFRFQGLESLAAEPAPGRG